MLELLVPPLLALDGVGRYLVKTSQTLLLEVVCDRERREVTSTQLPISLCVHSHAQRSLFFLVHLVY